MKTRLFGYGTTQEDKNIFDRNKILLKKEHNIFKDYEVEFILNNNNIDKRNSLFSIVADWTA